MQVGTICEPCLSEALYLHNQLTPLASHIAGQALRPSSTLVYAYSPEGSVPRHFDKLYCQFNMSMLLDYVPDPDVVSPWPLWLETPHNGTVLIFQRLGDGVFYKGAETAHFREVLADGHRSLSIIFEWTSLDYQGPLPEVAEPERLQKPRS